MSTSTERQTFRATVAQVAERAKAILPQEVNGRLEGAVKLVLLNEVEPQKNGSIHVGSCSDPTKVYHLLGTSCDCKDYPKAPSGWCRHRIAAGLHKRVREILTTQAVAAPAPQALPEAPASVNVHLTIGGRQVQLTLRDSDEAKLLARLEAVLARFPLPPAEASSPRTEQGKGWCAKHNVAMKENHKNGKTWWSHRAAEGQWCKGGGA